MSPLLGLDQTRIQVHLDVLLVGSLVIVELKADGIWVGGQRCLGLEVGPR